MPQRSQTLRERGEGGGRDSGEGGNYVVERGIVSYEASYGIGIG